MSYNIKLASSLILIFVFISCTSENYYTPESVIEANAKYMNEENFNAVMNTIHKESPSYPATESMIKQLFDRYDLDYKVVNMKVIQETDVESKIEFVQITTKLTGPQFKDNQTKGVHTLKKDGDSWKIYSTEIIDVQFLN